MEEYDGQHLLNTESNFKNNDFGQDPVFFVVHHQLIPRDMFHLIMQFIPAFPFYFMLRSVCRQWQSEFEDHIYAKVEHLNLVDDGKPKYYFRKDNDDDGQPSLVQFKPIGRIGTKVRLNDNDSRNYDKVYLFEKLAHLFPNVKHLRLGLNALEFIHFEQCVKTMLPKMTQLQSLDILGTANHNSRYLYPVMARLKLEMIVSSLPSSTKTLRIIGVAFNDSNDMLAGLKIFSDKGRRSMTESPSLPPWFSTLQNNAPYVNIQNLYLSYLFLDRMSVPLAINDWESLKENYSHFDVSVVESLHNQHASNLPVKSYVDFLNYMSRKEGVVLSYMEHINRRNSDEIIEAVIEIVVREYSHFQPLRALSTATEKVFQLEPQTILDSMFVFQHIFYPSTLRLLTDPSRMKYPELVFNIDSTFDRGYTMLSPLQELISQCSNVQMFHMLKTTIETYKPSMTINGVQNYLVSAITSLPYSPVRTDLIKYFLSEKPELITLGDLNGIINDDQKDCPIIQILLSRHYSVECLEDVKLLVSSGASLTQVDNDGNNVLHSACRMVDINLVKYLLSVCPESLIFDRNSKGETPIELIFSPHSPHGDIGLRLLFLQEVANLPLFKDQPLKDYQTSRGTLLHVASGSPHLEAIQWLLNNGFDANALNEKGENALFYCFSEGSQYSFEISCENQAEFVDECALELIKAGAKVDLENTEGETVVTSALLHQNYSLINNIIQTPSICSTPLSKLLAPRMKHGLNALHYIIQKMIEIVDEPDRDEKGTAAVYSVVRSCAKLCLKHHPGMLYEKSDESIQQNFSCVSPLQILLKARNGLHILRELSIKLNDIANQPVFISKDPEVIAPIPVIFLALGESHEMTSENALFNNLMKSTRNILARDETQQTKPNLLHIAAERDISMCKCIIKHWKNRFKKDFSQFVNQPLENCVDGQRPRNAALIACRFNQYAIFLLLWPFMKAVAEQFDCPVQVAFENNHFEFALAAVTKLGITPSKVRLHETIRKMLVEQRVNTFNQSGIISLLNHVEKKQSTPSWLELFVQTSSETAERLNVKSLSTLQLIVSEEASAMFNWLVHQYSDDPLLDYSLKSADSGTGNAMLNLLEGFTSKPSEKKRKVIRLLTKKNEEDYDNGSPRRQRKRSKKSE